MTRHPQDNAALLRTLIAGGFEFAIVGGVAAVLHGATRMTVDLDVLAPFTESNLQRLLGALASHDPRHATRPDLSLLDETPKRLCGFRMILVESQLGRLDVLPEQPPIGDYDAVDLVEMDVLGHTVKVIARDHLIAVKRALPRARDRQDAIELEAAKIRDEQQ
jgi:hypothetical protein